MIPFDISNDRRETRWRAHLAALPDGEPPDALWLRLQDAQCRARRTPQRARWPWFASAAVLALAVLLVTLPPSEPTVPSPARATQSFDMATASPSTVSITDPLNRAGLLRIDAALNRAYERNADATEIDALWQARKGLLDSLASNASAQLLQL